MTGRRNSLKGGRRKKHLPDLKQWTEAPVSKFQPLGFFSPSPPPLLMMSDFNLTQKVKVVFARDRRRSSSVSGSGFSSFKSETDLNFSPTRTGADFFFNHFFRRLLINSLWEVFILGFLASI